LCLTASDIAQYREVLRGTSSGRARPNQLDHGREGFQVETRPD
jgi:hypothetical protein